MAITIKDVAKLADVAPSTVSRVIANNPRISDKTKEKVKAAMDELGYHPNFIARSLANQSTRVIGLVLPNSTDVFFQNPFFPNVLRGLSDGANERQYALQISTGKTDDEIFEGVVQMVQGRRVDGVILLYSRTEDKVLNYLRDRKFPFVVIGKPFKDVEQINYVDNDNYKASKEATNYLLQLGHKQIGFIGGDLNFVVTIERILGFEKALKEANIESHDEYIINSEFLREGGQEAISQLLNLKNPPTALVVADDLMALGVLNTLTEMNISVPEDISILSFNNVLFSELSNPPLTSVDINIFELGYQASRSLIRLLSNENESVKQIIIPHKLIKRVSCSSKTENIKTGLSQK